MLIAGCGHHGTWKEIGCASRFVDWNINGFTAMEAKGELLAEMPWDVCALQEVTRDAWTSLLRLVEPADAGVAFDHVPRLWEILPAVESGPDRRTGRTAELRDEASRVVAEVKARILALSPDRLSTLPFEDRIEFIGGIVEAWYQGGVGQRVERLCRMRELEYVPRMARRAKLDIVSYLELLSHVSVRDRPPESHVPGVAEVLARLEEHGRDDTGGVGLPGRVSGDERGRLWVDA